jgi:hypothetical protein
MPKTIRIAKTAIDDAISAFSELPAKAPSDYSLREAIQQVLPAINDLIKRGYNLDEISTLLTQKNIPISSSTLKQYLRDFNQTKDKSNKAKLSSSGGSASSKSQVAVSSNSTGSKPVPSQDGVATSDANSVVSQEESVPNTGKNSTAPTASTVSTAGDTITDRDSTADKVVSTKKPYKSPPKPGAEQFK